MGPEELVDVLHQLPKRQQEDNNNTVANDDPRAHVNVEDSELKLLHRFIRREVENGSHSVSRDPTEVQQLVSRGVNSAELNVPTLQAKRVQRHSQ